MLEGLSVESTKGIILNKKSRDTISYSDLQETIIRIYDLAMGACEWEGLIQNMAHTFSAEQGVIRTINPDNRDVDLIHTYNKDPSFNQIYRDYYVNVDPWLEIYEKTTNLILCTHHYFSDEEYAKLEIYNDFIAPQKMHYGLGAIFELTKNQTAYAVFHRNRTQKGFEQDKLDTYKMLVPHLRQGLLMYGQLNHIKFEKYLLQDALNQVKNPMLLVDKMGVILFINTSGEKLIDQFPCISIWNNHLRISSIEHDQKLKKLIDQATVDNPSGAFKQGGAMNFRDPISQAPLYLLVNPVNPDKTNQISSRKEVAFISMGTDSYQSLITPELLIQLYDFSKAEARLAAWLCHGLTLKEVSENHNLSINTLKTQLRACFSKVGVDSQAKLINLINTGPARS